MFDVGFSELMVIGIVALIVIGPEKLPTVARTLGHLLGRAQRYVNDVKSDINREMQLEELKKLQSQLQTQLTDSARDFEQSIRDGVQETKAAVESAVDAGSTLLAEAKAASQEPALEQPEPAVDVPVSASLPSPQQTHTVSPT